MVDHHLPLFTSQCNLLVCLRSVLTPEAAVAGKDDCLGARPDAEFVENNGNVIGNRFFADRDPFHGELEPKSNS